MKITMIVLVFLTALLLPGGLIGLYIARRFYRQIYLCRGIGQLRAKLGITELAEPISQPPGVTK